MFCLALRTVFWTLTSLTLTFWSLNIHKLDDSFALKKDSMPCLSVFLYHILSFGSFGLNCKFIRREYGFSINSKISFMISGDIPILTESHSQIFADAFRYFSDFHVNIVLLGQNSFD